MRAHRKMPDNRMDMTVGPISFEVVEPSRQWRITLDENGIVEPYDTLCYELAGAGRLGFSLLN